MKNIAKKKTKQFHGNYPHLLLRAKEPIGNIISKYLLYLYTNPESIKEILFSVSTAELLSPKCQEGTLSELYS